MLASRTKIFIMDVESNQSSPKVTNIGTSTKWHRRYVIAGYKYNKQRLADFHRVHEAVF
jgi:hypothetical protein